MEWTKKTSLFQASSTASISDTASSRLSSYLSVLLLTFLNPMTITLLLALFARFKLTMTNGQDAFLFLIGIFSRFCHLVGHSSEHHAPAQAPACDTHFTYHPVDVCQSNHRIRCVRGHSVLLLSKTKETDITSGLFCFFI